MDVGNHTRRSRLHIYILGFPKKSIKKNYIVMEEETRPKKRPRTVLAETTSRKVTTGTNFQHIGTIRGHEHAISSIKFSHNGNFLCSGGADGKAIISDVNSCKVQRLLRATGSGISDVSWHSSNDYISLATDAGASIWDVETGRLRVDLGKNQHIGAQLCIDFNPQGNLTVTGALDGVARLWDVRSGNCVMRLEAHSRRICAASFNFDGNRFVTSSFDGLCRVWDTLNGQCSTTIVSPSMGSKGVPAVSAARFSPNGQYVLLSTLDSAIRLWDIDVGKCVKTYRGHANKAYCAFSTFCALNKVQVDGAGSEVGSAEGSGESGVSGQGGVEGTNSPQRIADTCIVGGSEDGNVYVWDLQSRELVQTLGAEGNAGGRARHLDMVLAVDSHPFLPIVASGSCAKDPTVRLWRNMQMQSDDT